VINQTGDVDAGRLQALARVRIVLVRTTHPGNIGGAARAMKTMGLGRLYLVDPKIFPSADATARAAGADDVLADAYVCSSLETALDGCELVLATTARNRRLEWPVGTPREAAVWVKEAAARGDVALVFGREDSGLSNTELDACQRVIRIPTSARFRSLNVAQAVQICAYEMRLAFSDEAAPGSEPMMAGDPVAGAEQLDDLFRHATGVMEAVGYFDPEQPKLLKRRLKRMFSRGRLLRSEVQILRGFLSAIEERLARNGNGPE
jgi:TrmH family RNA methyltransferase